METQTEGLYFTQNRLTVGKNTTEKTVKKSKNVKRHQSIDIRVKETFRFKTPEAQCI